MGIMGYKGSSQGLQVLWGLWGLQKGVPKDYNIEDYKFYGDYGDYKGSSQGLQRKCPRIILRITINLKKNLLQH